MTDYNVVIRRYISVFNVFVNSFTAQQRAVTIDAVKLGGKKREVVMPSSFFKG